MDPRLIAAGIGAGLGAGKYFLEDVPRRERDMRMYEQAQRWSPWTGVKAEGYRPNDISLLGNVLGGGMTGADTIQRAGGGAPLTGAGGASTLSPASPTGAPAQGQAAMPAQSPASPGYQTIGGGLGSFQEFRDWTNRNSPVFQSTHERQMKEKEAQKNSKASTPMLYGRAPWMGMGMEG